MRFKRGGGVEDGSREAIRRGSAGCSEGWEGDWWEPHHLNSLANCVRGRFLNLVFEPILQK